LAFLGVLELGVHVLKMLQGGTGVKTLGASQGAQTNLVALADLHVTTKHLQTLVSVLITGVNHPSVGLHEHGWSQVVLRMPPVAGACRLAAGAEHAFVETVEKLTLFNGLQVFLHLEVSGHLLALQVWLDRLVLGVEVRHIDDEILQHKHEHQG